MTAMQPETKKSINSFLRSLCALASSLLLALWEHPTWVPVPTRPFHCTLEGHQWSLPCQIQCQSLSSAALHIVHHSLFLKLLASRTPDSPGLPVASLDPLPQALLMAPEFLSLLTSTEFCLYMMEFCRAWLSDLFSSYPHPCLWYNTAFMLMIPR